MKYLILSITGLCAAFVLSAQTYPDPEFANEVYWYRKDSSKLVRLEKSSSKMENKTKAMGLGGMENGYTLDGEKSPVRLNNGSNLSFIFSTGATASSGSTNHGSDSVMRANGIDPSMMQGFGNMTDPASQITLYKVDVAKGNRKIYLMKMGGVMSLNHKNQSSDKYTFSLKKIRDGYWELIIDKTLPKGEYSFSMTGMGMTGMDGSTSLYAFGVD